MTTERDLWVFGYGSLMWRPGFDYDEVKPAVLKGWRRGFCIYSRHWRGTPDHPGLVLGLDAGGSCRGLAFRVARQRAASVIDYLNERELIGYAYVARTLDIDFDDGRVEPAYTFVADTAHHHYAGHLPLQRAAAIIMDAQGCAGLNRDYLINTIRQLEQEGFSEPDLHALLVEVERQTGIIEAGSGI
ncbi:gamma-glutamylcyclotransferase [Paramagnetospirillum kuznetsovii]|uniref:glutathione-specific gamma-glutamylcyclotransferase n=1 Tax=Paramagnetospirillum kuznetsovii TaxID=2053833 RepID=A0A364NVA8_9PROT|nr:gamma-glutamylcyclotransferase [Paramagnetospirillum kuznetsovii]RAU20992.1 gamma-glutamylcyclotransferase [Paramagnetospirillum kuznetsovii]